ncbi:MAG: hypothetical protein WC648_04075 [Candidatus Paceibacterota bacterium]
MMMATYMSEKEILEMPYKRFMAYMDDVDYLNSDKDKRKMIDNTLDLRYLGHSSHDSDEFGKQIKNFVKTR